MEDAIIHILKSGTGCGVELFDILRLYPLEDGRFAVVYDEEEQIFDSAEEATDEFLTIREDMKLGFDYEGD